MAVKIGWQGRFFEDFEIGDIYRHPLGRTVEAGDNTWFTLLTMNTNQAHFNTQVGEQSEFGQRLVASPLTLAISIGQSVTDLTQNAFANLGMDKVAFTAPVFAGDTIWSESRVLTKRRSRSRPDAGIVTVGTRALNQHGTVICSYERTFYVYSRSATRAAPPFPTTETAWPDSEESS